MGEEEEEEEEVAFGKGGESDCYITNGRNTS